MKGVVILLVVMATAYVVREVSDHWPPVSRGHVYDPKGHGDPV